MLVFKNKLIQIVIWVFLYTFNLTVNSVNQDINTFNPNISTFSTPTRILFANFKEFKVKISKTQVPILSLRNHSANHMMKIIWICTSSITSTVADGNVITVFNVIKNGRLIGDQFNWYSQYFSTKQFSQALLDISATTVLDGTQVLSFFTSGNSSSNLLIPTSDAIFLLPGETITVAANTTATNSVNAEATIAISLTWQEFSLSSSNTNVTT